MAETGGDTVVIGNPSAGRGKVGRCWSDLLARLQGAGLRVEGHLTKGPGHATELARQARVEGQDLVVAVGGDGTVNEIVNGLLGAGGDGDAAGAGGADGRTAAVPALGLIPVGSGSDYARTLGVPRDVDGAVAHLASASIRNLDVGEIRYQGEGGEASRLFVNVVEVGIGAEVATRAAPLPRSLGALRYVAAFALALPRHRPGTVRIELGADLYEGPLTNLVVALGQYFGGGMRIAPGADPTGGSFAVQVQFGSKLDYVLAMPKVFRGTHLPHPRVREAQTPVVHVQGAASTPVEADGEVLGTTPVSLRVRPRALPVRA